MQGLELLQNYLTAIVAVSLLLIPACSHPADNATVGPLTCAFDNITMPASHNIIYTMKGVGIDLPQSDFENMRKAGITILATEWGMEESVEKARAFLDQAEKAGLKVVMDGGFSSTAWGFTVEDWDNLPRGKHPVWQKERVQTWIRALQDHPAIYAWDISNEFGENLPSGAGITGSDWPKGRLTTEQLIKARADVLEVDKSRPVHVRMYGWDVENMQPHVKAMLTNRIADIISLNLYSNYLDKGKLQWPDVIQDAGQYYVDNIKALSPGTVVWISVAAFEYPKLFQKPTLAGLDRDLKHVSLIRNLDGISFFCWGPVNQWDSKGNWYLPKTGTDIWDMIKRYMKDPARFISN
jgi:hypothetical protein